MTTKRRGSLPGPRPHTWKSGPDPIEHKKYLNWLQQKNQAKYRGEEWLLDFETWKAVWYDLWQFKGRASGDLCMTRIDDKGSWDKDNVEIVTRREHVLRQGEKRNPNWRSGPKPRKAKNVASSSGK